MLSVTSATVSYIIFMSYLSMATKPKITIYDDSHMNSLFKYRKLNSSNKYDIELYLTPHALYPCDIMKRRINKEGFDKNKIHICDLLDHFNNEKVPKSDLYLYFVDGFITEPLENIKFLPTNKTYVFTTCNIIESAVKKIGYTVEKTNRDIKTREFEFGNTRIEEIIEDHMKKQNL